MLAAQQRFLENASYRYKIGRHVAKEMVKRSNGFPQGLSGSITAALSVMTLWHRAVEEAAPEARTSSLMDDSNIRTEGPSHADTMDKAWKASCKVDEVLGNKVNLKKTVFASNTEKGEEEVREVIVDSPFVKHFPLVGADITIRGAPPIKRRGQRQDAAVKITRKARVLRGPSFRRARIVQAAAITRGVFGTEPNGLFGKRRQNWRSAVMSTLYPKGRSNRSMAVSMCFTHKGHLLDPAQAELYHPLVMVRRLLQKTTATAQALRRKVQQAWPEYMANPGLKRGTPLSRLDEIRLKLGWEWTAPFKRKTGAAMSLVGHDPGWWLHELREDIRKATLRDDPDLQKREDVCAAAEGQVAYEISTAPLRAREVKRKKPPQVEEQKEATDSAATEKDTQQQQRQQQEGKEGDARGTAVTTGAEGEQGTTSVLPEGHEVTARRGAAVAIGAEGEQGLHPALSEGHEVTARHGAPPAPVRLVGLLSRKVL